MQSDDFVKAVKIAVRDSAVSGTLTLLQKVPGRRPRADILEMSEWFNTLKAQDRKMLERVIQEAVDQAVFGFFAVLDGIRAVENKSDKGDLELYYVKGSKRIRLNNPSQPLHNIFNAMDQG